MCKGNSLFNISKELTEQWHPTLNGELTPHDVTIGSSKKVWWIGECGHEWNSIVKSRIKGSGCPYCANKKVLKGLNDIHTTNPKLGSNLLNYEDGYKFTQFSSKKVDWECHNCNKTIRDKKISDVNIYGLSCPDCSDGISFGEKVMREVLNQLKVDYKNDSVLPWSENKRYDFYIEENNIIIEMHGKQHSRNNGFSTLGGKSLDEEKKNDEYKYNLAKSNGINKYFEIDYIKNQLLNSELSNIYDFKIIDWVKVNLYAQKSHSYECLILWNQGIREISLIAKKMKISEVTVRSYLKQWTYLKMCNYEKQNNSILIQFDLNGNIIKEWNSISEVVRELKPLINRNSLNKVLLGLNEMAGGYHWKYKSTRKLAVNNRARKVAMLDSDLNLMEEYNSIAEACVINGIKNYSEITACCKGRRKHCGGYRWMYFEDYQELIK